jgi:hypothetical protein
LQNWLNSSGWTPPVPLPLVLVPLPLVPPEDVPPDEAPPVEPVEVPPVPLCVDCCCWVWPVPVELDEVDDWLCVCVWSPFVLVWSLGVDVWSAEVLLELEASLSAPCGSARLGTWEGTTSVDELSLPQALTPRPATTRSASTYVRMGERVERF